MTAGSIVQRRLPRPALTVRWRKPRSPRIGPRSARAAIVTFVALFVLWHLVSMVAGTSSISGQRLVPNIIDLAGAFRSLSNWWVGGLGVPTTGSGHAETYSGALLSIFYHTAVTLGRLAGGLLLGMGAGLVVACIVGWSRIGRRLFRFPAHSARMIPLLAMMPLFGLWFGNTDTGAVLFVAVAAFPIVFVVAETAIAAVPEAFSNSARTLGAGRLRTYFTVVIPAAVPQVRGGIMLALGQSWSMVIAAEFLGQPTGLGNIVNQSEQFGHTNIIALVGLHVVICAGLTFALAGWAFGRITRWSE
ncbi:sulfonate transport system permease protein [Gordonia westfalica]|uniref:Sulfonate transport system permease protein n=1 Tax=Gordonia westfalica TaxID=158898 RepID=A0A1H2KY84_9ACTN|nr:sulfonate transport system permease protein [Gordonia westfalica]